MNWPWKTDKPRAWRPPVDRWGILLAVPVPEGLKQMEHREQYLDLLARRVQWMLDRSDLTLHEFHRMVWDAGEVGLSMGGGVDLENAGERLLADDSTLTTQMTFSDDSTNTTILLVRNPSTQPNTDRGSSSGPRNIRTGLQ